MFDDLGGLSWLHSTGVVGYKNCLLGFDTHEALCIVFTVDGSVICLDTEILLALDVESRGPEL